MLIITRRVGEALNIGPNISIMIKEVQGKQVKIAISAPRSVAISRAELELQLTTVHVGGESSDEGEVGIGGGDAG